MLDTHHHVPNTDDARNFFFISREGRLKQRTVLEHYAFFQTALSIPATLHVRALNVSRTLVTQSKHCQDDSGRLSDDSGAIPNSTSGTHSPLVILLQQLSHNTYQRPPKIAKRASRCRRKMFQKPLGCCSKRR